MKDSLQKDGRRREATAEEIETLPHVIDSIPFLVWIALAAAAGDRFTFYAIAAPWQNYIQNSPNDNHGAALPGVLGLGQVTATSISNGFYLLTAVTPLPFAIISDGWLGRHSVLIISYCLNLLGCLVLFTTSLPSITSYSSKIGGLSLSLTLLAFGNGGVKATIAPFIADQYTTEVPHLVIRPNGKMVVTDRTLTLQYIYNLLYWFTNISALSSSIAATYLEKDVGFWAAYLLPLCSFSVSISLLTLWSKSFVKPPPQTNPLPKALKVLTFTFPHFNLTTALPSHHPAPLPWDEPFVLSLQRGLKAFQVMSCFVPFYLCISQLSNNLVSQAGQMSLGPIPNDMIIALNDISCILLGPVIQNLVYPVLQRHGIPFGPIRRMAVAFLAVGMAMGYAAVVQRVIYEAPPCFESPLVCAGGEPNEISVWVQMPVYILLAVGEILGFTTLSEYSYSESPVEMRSVVQALKQVTSGIGSAMAIALSREARDPEVLYLYVGLAVTMGVWSGWFWVVFGGRDGRRDEGGGGVHGDGDGDGDTNRGGESSTEGSKG